MLRKFVFSCLLATSAVAEPVTVEFLEQPGIVWVAATPPESVQMGLIVSMVPYLKFEAGRFESGLMTGSALIYSSDCDDLFTCSERTSIGVTLEGPYELTDVGVRALEPTSPGWMFEREESNRMALSEGGMYGGIAVLERDGPFLVQTRITGQRTYVPLPQDLQRAAIDLPYYFNISIVANYACVMEPVTQMAITSSDNWTPEQHQLQALAVYVRRFVALHTESEILSGIVGFDPEHERHDELRALELRRATFTLVGSSITDENLNEQGDGLSDLALAEIEETLRLMAERVDTPMDLVTEFEELLPYINAAAPLVARIKTVTGEGGVEPLRGVLCSE